MFSTLLDQINRVADGWTIWMVAASVDAAFVLLLVGVVWLLMRRRVVPQVGIFLFLLVPLKLLVPIPISAPNSIAAWSPSAIVARTMFTAHETTPPPTSTLDSKSTESSRVFSQAELPADVNPKQSELDAAISSALPSDAALVASKKEVRKDNAASSHGDVADLPHAGKVTASLKLSAWFLLGWLTVFGFFTLRLVINEFRFRKRLQSATIISDDDLPFDFQELCQLAVVRRPVRLIASNAVSAPAVHGIFRPSIILAEETVSQLSAPQLRWALLHELAHIRRCDLYVIFFQRIVSWLFFFHPAVWIANRMVHQLREYACDDQAMLQNGDRTTVAGDAFLRILKAANGVQPQETLALSLLGMGPRERSQNRLMRMLDTDRTIVTRPSWISLCAVLLTAAVTLPQFAAASQDAAPDEKSDDVVSTKPEPNQKQPWRFDLQVNDLQGNPVVNARIGLRRNLKEFGEVRIGEHLGVTKHRMEYRCDEQGRFAVDFAGLPKGLQLFIEHDGYEPYVANWANCNASNQIPHKFTAKLDQAWVLGGRVVDEDGKPIEGVELNLGIEYKKRPGDHRQWGTGDQVTTDADGKWIFRRAPNSTEQVSVEIDHSEFSPRVMELARFQFEIDSSDDSKKGGRIELARGHTVSGQVLDENGKPIDGAVLRTRFVNVRRETKTGLDGRYAIKGCPSKLTKIAVTAPSMAFERKQIAITSDLKGFDFELEPSKGIRVRVVDEEGKPLPKAQIFFQQWRGDHAYFVFEHINRYTDENGVWEWKEAPVDEFTADICRHGGMNLAYTKLVAREEEYVFTPPEQLFVSGTVTDKVTGEKIKSFHVIPGFQRSNGTPNWLETRTLNATDGGFRIKHSSQTCESHFVRIEADGYRPIVSRNIKSDEGEVSVDLKLERAADMSSQVVDPQGKPVADALVVLCPVGSQIIIENGRLAKSGCFNIRRTRTDAAGKFDFPLSLELFHLVVLHDRGFVHLKPEGTFTEESDDASLPDRVTLTPWAILEGTYFASMDPVPASQIKVTASEMDFRYNSDNFFFVVRSRAMTDENGKFRFDRVFPGENKVEYEVDPSSIGTTSTAQLTFPAVADELKRIRLGGSGVTVFGKLLMPDDKSEDLTWKTGWIRLRESNPSTAFAQPARIGPNGLGGVRRPAPAKKKPIRSFYATPDREGRFRIDDVPEGEWNLSGGTGDLNVSLEPTVVTISRDDIAAGDAGKAKNIGEIPSRVR